MRNVVLVVAAAGLAVGLALPVHAQAAPDPSRAKASVDSLRSELDAATRSYVEAREALEEIDAELRAAQRELDASAEQAATARKLLAQHAVSAYRSGGGLNPLSTLLTQDSDQAIERIELATVMASHQKRQLQDARALAASYEQAVKRYSAARARRQALLDKQEAAVAALNKRFRAAEALYRQELAEARAAEARLVAARAPRAASFAAQAADGSAAVVSGGLACPVEGPYSYIDSWGAARSGGRAHKGTDILAPHGKTVYAYTDGEIFRTTVDSGLGGTTVWLRGEDGTEYYYAHLDSFSVQEGQQVEAGDVIGVNGSTGNATADAPHVHFEVHPGGGEAVNPYPYVHRACG